MEQAEKVYQVRAMALNLAYFDHNMEKRMEIINFANSLDFNYQLASYFDSDLPIMW